MWSKICSFETALLLVIAKFVLRSVEVAIRFSRRSATRALTIFQHCRSILSKAISILTRCEIFSTIPYHVSSFRCDLMSRSEIFQRKVFSRFSIYIYSTHWQMLQETISMFLTNIAFITLEIATRKRLQRSFPRLLMWGKLAFLTKRTER